MSDPNELSEEQFLACFADPMKNVTAQAEAIVDIWPYADALDLGAFGIHKILDVVHVYRGGDEAYEQVLIATDKPNSMLVIVVDLCSSSIFGHHILNVHEKYSLA